MCQSYRVTCSCGLETAEIFFGRMVLDENAVAKGYCPKCSHDIDIDSVGRVYDNGWILELNMDFVRSRANLMGISPDNVTADWVFDEGYATWVGITPDDYRKRDLERAKIQDLAKTDLLAYMKAMKEWGLSREKRFMSEGWRKMQPRV